LKASISSAAFVGSDAFQSSITGGLVELNIASGSGVTDTTPVMDFSKLNNNTGYPVATSTSGPPTVLNFSSRLIHASADNVLLTVGGFLYVKGGVALDIGSQQTVIVNTGIPASLANLVPANTLSLINGALQTLSGGLTSLQASINDRINSAIDTVKATVNNAVDSVVQTIVDKITAELQSTLADAKQAVTESLTSALTTATGS